MEADNSGPPSEKVPLGCCVCREILKQGNNSFLAINRHVFRADQFTYIHGHLCVLSRFSKVKEQLIGHAPLAVSAPLPFAIIGIRHEFQATAKAVFKP